MNARADPNALLEAFNRRFGTNMSAIKTNSRDASKGVVQFEESDIEEFCRLNMRDIELYNLAVSRYWSEANYPRAGVRYLSRFQGSARRTEDGGVAGLAVDHDSHSPIRVVVLADGREVLSCSACLYRPDTIKQGVHLTGYCGFKIKPHALASVVGGAKEFEVHVPGFRTIYKGGLLD